MKILRRWVTKNA
jgi:uncharacterized protein